MSQKKEFIKEAIKAHFKIFQDPENGSAVRLDIILHSNCSFATNHHEVRSILIILQSFFAAGFGLVEDVAVALAASTKVARRQDKVNCLEATSFGSSASSSFEATNQFAAIDSSVAIIAIAKQANQHHFVCDF